MASIDTASRAGCARMARTERVAIVPAVLPGPAMRRLILILLLTAAPALAQVGTTDGPKGVVVNSANGKAYAAYPELGVVKIIHGDRVKTLATGANVKDLTFDPRNGRVYAIIRGPGTVAVIDPDSDSVIQTIM